MDSSLFPFLVADVGGTNARFGLALGLDKTSKRFSIENQKELLCRDFESLEAVIGSYLSGFPETRITSACIAIAGPVTGDSVTMTNLNWNFSIEEIRNTFGLARLEVINDFGAQAYATLYMDQDDFVVLAPGKSHPTGNRAVLGPGTGLGVAALINSGDQWHTVCGEGGHISYAPTSRIEMDLRTAIDPSGAHISVENLVSGPGLVNIYKALAQIKGVKAEDITPAEISGRALQESDPNCSEAVALFCKILGSAAGDIALVTGAFGGVYLCGGILPKIESLLTTSQLVSGFRNKGVMAEVMESVPLCLV
ncbi:UNVERIFIED_CONTAM: hypothetical protein GTU68_032740, partial [Idotea baltica]|nr:hypothetical protein [Idotea baltica]